MHKHNTKLVTELHNMMVTPLEIMRQTENDKPTASSWPIIVKSHHHCKTAAYEIEYLECFFVLK